MFQIRANHDEMLKGENVDTIAEAINKYLNVDP